MTSKTFFQKAKAKSEDTISTFCSISLLFPIKVIPLILFVNFPSSISLAVSTAKLKSPVAGFTVPPDIFSQYTPNFIPFSISLNVSVPGFKYVLLILEVGA